MRDQKRTLIEEQEGGRKKFLLKKITLTAVPVRVFEGDFSGLVSTIRADPTNANTAYVKADGEDGYPLNADDAQITAVDLNRFVFWGTAGQFIWVWAERNKGIAVGFGGV